MDKLEFENFEMWVPSQKDEQSPREKALDKRSKNQLAENEAVELSGKIVKALSSKLRGHNKEYPTQKVTLSQLKKVYRRGAAVNEELKNVWAMARVNMFLRMKTGESIKASKKVEPVRVDNFIDISASWSPSELDFELAEKDVEEYGISNFNSVDDLYLEEYTRMGTWITWG